MGTDIYLEVGRKRVFACAVDCPGWARSPRTEDDCASSAGCPGPPAPSSARRLPAGRGTTGRPTSTGWPACWVGAGGEFDPVVAGVPAQLRKGPLGGGRDRDPIVDHVRAAERSHGRSIGVRRAALAAGVRAGPAGTSRPVDDHVRRSAWHVLDHA